MIGDVWNLWEFGGKTQYHQDMNCFLPQLVLFGFPLTLDLCNNLESLIIMEKGKQPLAPSTTWPPFLADTAGRNERAAQEVWVILLFMGRSIVRKSTFQLKGTKNPPTSTSQTLAGEPEWICNSCFSKSNLPVVTSHLGNTISRRPPTGCFRRQPSDGPVRIITLIYHFYMYVCLCVCIYWHIYIDIHIYIQDQEGEV